MKKFIDKKNHFYSDQQQIINSISSADEEFDSMRKKLITVKENILNEFEYFKKDSLQIYDNSYHQITRFIEESYQSSKEIINMIPPATSERLKNEVLLINTDYLDVKKALIKSLYLMKNEILCQQDSIIDEFEKKKEDWNSNRFLVLIERVKDKLHPISPINYGSLYERFYKDQGKFNNCFKKAVADVSLIIPPNHFTNESFKNWWCEVENLLECHTNFIKQFSNQFQAKLNQHIEDNNNLISDLEKELLELTCNMNDSEGDHKVQQVIDELAPICKANEKVNIQFFDKIQNYFNYRQECLRKSFESIRDFYQKMIESHNQYIAKLAEREEIEINEIEQLKANSKSEIDRLESEISESKEKIGLLVSGSEIDAETARCKQLLSQIEQEERNYFKNMSNVFDQQPSKVLQIFEESEKVVLENFKLKKNSDSKSSMNTKKQSKSKKYSKGGRLKSQDIESFTIDCGITFESSEPLTVIPSFDDFFDSPLFQSSSEKVQPKSDKNERTRKPSLSKRTSSNLISKPSSKSGRKSSSKSGNQLKQSFLDFEFNESMIPSFELNDVIPKIDDKISIWICLPTSEDFSEFLTQFKVIYLNNFYSIFEENMKKAQNEENKEKLASQLNENLRVLNPRFASIEINVAEARKVKISSNKDQLELHFRKISVQFNLLVSKFKSKSDTNEKIVVNEVERLKKFVDDLALQKNDRALTFHSENFRLSNKSCQLKIDNFFKSQENSIDSFFNFFRTKNDRFKDACLDKNVINSEEEKKMALAYFENMDKQMNDIQKELKMNFQTSKKQIENLHKEALNAFQNSFQFHKIDVKFIEENSAIQTEFKRKFESLTTQNFHQEQEIQKALDDVEFIINENKFENYQDKINLIFNSLENLRAKILNRSFFLNQLKSDIQNYSSCYKIDFNENKELKDALPQQSEQLEKPTPKKGPSKTKSSKSRSAPRNQIKKEESKNQPKNDNQVTSFCQKLENLKSDFTSRLTDISHEYYSQLKTRKAEITRPDEIPQTQNEFLAKINVFWSNLTKSKDSILNDSILKFRYQVSNALTKSKEAEKMIYIIFINFYSTQNENEMKIMKNEIDKEINGFTIEKEKSRSFLDLKISDENNNEQLEKIVEDEARRTQNERDFIKKIKIRLFEYGNNCIQKFQSKLNFLTGLSLSLFDRFVLIEDLIDGPTVENERKTITELKKNKIRFSEAYSNNIFKRPFTIRTWPKMSQLTKSVAQFDASKIENFENFNENSEEFKNKRKKSKISETDTLQFEQQKETLRPDSTKPSGRKQKEPKNKKDKNIQNEFEIKSYDSPIHRTVIIERNKALSDFDNDLSERAKKFNEFINTIENNENNFSNFWNQSILSLRPNYFLPKLEPPTGI